MKLNWRLSFVIGLGFLSVNVVWLVYDVFLPIFLQSGSPSFDAQRVKMTALGFGMDASSTGFIMAFDNIAAVFLMPLVGIWSDRTRTRIGRRYPYILASVPAAAVAFTLLAVAAHQITPATNGSISTNSSAFALLIGAILLLCVAMSVFRTPVIALISDLTPSEHLAKANGVVDFMGGVGGIIATLAIIPLFDKGFFLPFLATSAVLLIANFALFALVKEPTDVITDQPQRQLSLTAVLRRLSPDSRHSLVLLLIAIFGWFIAFNTIEAFFSSYAVTTLGLSIANAGLLFSIALVVFILFSIPAGFIGTAIGRKRAILLGIVLFGLALLAAYFTVNLVLVGIILAVSGVGFALINTNSLPMVIDVGDNNQWIGTYTGLYYFASQLAAIAAPIISGILIDANQRNYTIIFLVMPCFLVLSFVAVALTTRGEARQISPVQLT